MHLLQIPDEERPGKAAVTVHNIGAAAVRDAKITVLERSLKTGAAHTVFERTIGGLPAPQDLTSQTRTIEFQWSSQLSGAVELQVRVDAGGDEPEISTQNNSRTIAVSAEALTATEQSP